MATVYLLDSVKVATSTTGTGSVTVGAAEPGYLTPAEAGAVDGRVYTWRLDDGDDFEIFLGTYSSTGPTVSRDTVLVSKISGTAGTSKINLSGTAKLSAVPVADYVVTPRQIREKLTADRTYYVRTDGSDSNDGLTDSPGGAFRTIQKAVDTVADLDINGHKVTIQLADGTYTAGALLKNVAGFAAPGDLVIRGNQSTPANVVVQVADTGHEAAGVFHSEGIASVWDILDLKISTTTRGSCILSKTAYVRFGNVNFGSAAHFHIHAVEQGYVEAIGNYAISGGAGVHIYSSGPSSTIAVNGRTVTLSGTPAFSVRFAFATDLAFIRADSMTFSGTGATGQRYSVARNAVIRVNGGGANYFPGNSAGSESQGGLYY